jgi:hypothetical protein
MRKKSGKSINHLLLHCEAVRDFVGFGFPSFQDRMVGNAPNRWSFWRVGEANMVVTAI